MFERISKGAGFWQIIQLPVGFGEHLIGFACGGTTPDEIRGESVSSSDSYSH